MLIVITFAGYSGMKNSLPSVVIDHDGKVVVRPQAVHIINFGQESLLKHISDKV